MPCRRRFVQKVESAMKSKKNGSVPKRKFDSAYEVTPRAAGDYRFAEQQDFWQPLRSKKFEFGAHEKSKEL